MITDRLLRFLLTLESIVDVSSSMSESNASLNFIFSGWKRRTSIFGKSEYIMLEFQSSSGKLLIRKAYFWGGGASDCLFLVFFDLGRLISNESSFSSSIIFPNEL